MQTWIVIVGLLLLAAFFAETLARACRKVANAVDTAPLLSLLASARKEPDVAAAARALRRCSFCASGETCRQRIAAKASLPAYCPNADFLARIR